MAAYRLTSDITPICPQSHRITVRAIATDSRNEVVRMDIAPTIIESETRRAILLALLETRLRKGGHEVVDPVED